MTTRRSSFSIAFFISGRRVCEFGAWPQNTIARTLSGWVDVLLGFQNAVDPARNRDALLGRAPSVLSWMVESGRACSRSRHPRRGTSASKPPSTGRNSPAGCGTARRDRSRPAHCRGRGRCWCRRRPRAHVTQGQLQDAVGAGVVVAVGVLGAAHAPDHGARRLLASVRATRRAASRARR